jgi:ankyrin repeat protein
MAAAHLVLMSELRILISKKKIDAAIAFLQRNAAQLKKAMIDDATILHHLVKISFSIELLLPVERLFKLLLEYGAAIDAKEDFTQYTPLHRAIIENIEPMVHLLLENGADIEAKENDEWTPLHWAAHKGNESIVRLLLESGADVKAQNGDEKTPLDFAKKSNNKLV